MWHYFISSSQQPCEVLCSHSAEEVTGSDRVSDLFKGIQQVNESQDLNFHPGNSKRLVNPVLSVLFAIKFYQAHPITLPIRGLPSLKSRLCELVGIK